MRNIWLKLLAVAATGLLAVVDVQALELTGRVVSIADGDTLTILDAEKQQQKIRLADIDAPERKQPFGTRSRQALAQMCFQKVAQVSVQGKDRWGRVIGRVNCSGIDTSAEQVRTGMAWVFVRYAPSSPLIVVEQEARRAKVGLWSDPNPIAPWDWRDAKRKK